MSDSPKKEPAGTDADATGMLHEADIGSGERSPGQQETDEIIKSIPPLPGKPLLNDPAPAPDQKEA
jgi:hypothetical protein